MPELNLTPECLAQVKAILKQHVPESEVWAYGSRVNGTAHSGSDLDLVIRSKDLAPLPRAIYAGICEKIRDSNIPILVELRDWAYLPESFHANIERQFEPLFDNRGRYAA